MRFTKNVTAAAAAAAAEAAIKSSQESSGNVPKITVLNVRENVPKFTTSLSL